MDRDLPSLRWLLKTANHTPITTEGQVVQTIDHWNGAPQSEPAVVRGTSMVLACALLAALAAPLQAQTHSVTVAWDASPDPSVIGYVVYVGTEPGAPREQFQVNEASFVYPNAASGRPYFFSVAAYAAGARVGSRSDEVLFLGGARDVASTSNRAAGAALRDDEKRGAADAAVATASPSGASTMEQVCLRDSGADCYAAVASIGDFGQVNNLKALGDGRLILIDNDTRILIVNTEGEDTRTAARVTTDGVRFVSLAVDPQFIVTHLIYVAEAAVSADGAAQVDIARYREVDGRLGERAVVISGLPGPRDGNSEITLDASGHLFVALPRTDSDRVDSYAGMVLRFRTDGSLPSDNRAVSPLFAEGVSQPAALEWESATNSLWLADARAQLAAPLRRVRLDRESAGWPRESEIVDVADLSRVAAVSFAPRNLHHGFIVAGQPAELLVITEDANGVLRTTALPGALLDGEPTSVVADRGELDVAVRIADANSKFTTRIVRLRSLSSGH
jgi:hypothetical protein